ncbi:hypothetical protein ACHAXR_013478 [Thalassiosira sp. AJA248-18]
MPNTIINKALALIGEATKLESEGKAICDQTPTPLKHERQPSWVVLEQSAFKYHEACYFMKRANPEDAATKKLLVENIDRYETHADDLLKKVKVLKVSDQQQQQQQQNMNTDCSNRSSGNNSESVQKGHKREISISPYEGSHGPHEHGPQPQAQLYPPNTKNGAGNKDIKALESTKSADKANRFFGTALDHDERGQSSKAISQYLNAVQCYSHAIKLLSSEREGGEGGTAAIGESPWQSPESSTAAHKDVVSLKRKQQSALDRVEELKAAAEPSAPMQPPIHHPSQPTRTLTPYEIDPDRLTPYEIKVLKWSSRIASGVFLPWSDEEALKFNGSPTRSWLDPKENHLLPLSDKQVEKGCKWARPSEIVAMRHKSPSSCKITMINSITPYTIKQHCVSDCSFIAGLCISAAFERRFHRRLVSSLIYPQDPVTRMPVYNPHGVYMVKLWLNGVARRVIVDDLLPVDERGNLLCSHTTNLGKKADGNNVLELWVPILEKAYMKLCGGYNFPGSNSGVDLFCLTGWIPERIFFPEDPRNVRDFETSVERAWDRLYSANSYGDCLITVSTSKELTEEQAEKVGLFTGHAYAVLGVVQTSNGTKLLQLKNPWASQGWKGRFSSQDKVSWKDPGFCAEVGYDATSASQYDDGVFWMAWDDILLYFRNIHMSWNTDPQLFRFRTKVHGYWAKDMGPTDDSFNVGENPQYTVTLSPKAIASKAKLWILLSRHVTKLEQEGGEVNDFLTLHIHRIKNPKQRVWYPDSECVLTGAYTNNQHVLVRYDVEVPEDRFLSIVLSQYKKSKDLGYTLACYCTEEFALGNTEQGLPLCQKLEGSWKLRDSLTDKSNSLAIGTAGGPPGKGSFGSNPQWSIRVPEGGGRIQAKCFVSKDLAMNVILARSTPSGSQQNMNEQRSKRIHHLYEEPIIDTGNYRHGFAASEAVFVPAGLYTLVTSTFEPGQVGKFLLHVFSSKQIHISEIE